MQQQLKEIIECAVRGNWRLENRETEFGGGFAENCPIFSLDGGSCIKILTPQELFIDKTFWESLGKESGWCREEEFYPETPFDICFDYKRRAIRFYEFNLILFFEEAVEWLYQQIKK